MYLYWALLGGYSEQVNYTSVAYLIMLEGPSLYVPTFTCPDSPADRNQLPGTEFTRSTDISPDAAVLRLARVWLVSLLVLVVVIIVIIVVVVVPLLQKIFRLYRHVFAQQCDTIILRDVRLIFPSRLFD